MTREKLIEAMARTLDKMDEAAVEQRMADERAKAVAADYGVGLRPIFGGYAFTGSPAAVERFKRALAASPYRRET